MPLKFRGTCSKISLSCHEACAKTTCNNCWSRRLGNNVLVATFKCERHFFVQGRALHQHTVDCMFRKLKPSRRRTHAQEKRTHAMTFAELFLVGRLAVSKIISKQGASDYTSAPGAGPQGESDGNARLCYSTSFGFI